MSNIIILVYYIYLAFLHVIPLHKNDSCIFFLPESKGFSMNNCIGTVQKRLNLI